MITSDKIQLIQQALYETLSWERMLDYFLQENSYLKIRLSQLIDSIDDTNLIVTAEYFQTLFIDTDAHITDLRSDVTGLQKIIQDCLLGKNSFNQRLIQQKRRIVKDVAYFEKRFPELKNEFNSFAKKWIRISDD